MGCRLIRLDEPVLMAVSKPMLTEFGIHLRLESCAYIQKVFDDFDEQLQVSFVVDSGGAVP